MAEVTILPEGAVHPRNRPAVEESSILGKILESVFPGNVPETERSRAGRKRATRPLLPQAPVSAIPLQIPEPPQAAPLERPTRTRSQRFGDLVDEAGDFLRTEAFRIPTPAELLSGITGGTELGLDLNPPVKGEDVSSAVEALAQEEPQPQAARATAQVSATGGRRGTRGAAISPIEVPPLASTESFANPVLEGMKRNELLAQLQALLPEGQTVPDEFSSALAGATSALANRRRGLGAALLALGGGSQAGLRARESQIGANAEARRRAELSNLETMLAFDDSQRNAKFAMQQVANQNLQQKRNLEFQAALAAQQATQAMKRARIAASAAGSSGGLSARDQLAILRSRQAAQGDPQFAMQVLQNDPDGRLLLQQAAKNQEILFGVPGAEIDSTQAGVLLDEVMRLPGGTEAMTELAPQITFLADLRALGKTSSPLR